MATMLIVGSPARATSELPPAQIAGLKSDADQCVLQQRRHRGGLVRMDG